MSKRQSAIRRADNGQAELFAQVDHAKALSDRRGALDKLREVVDFEVSLRRENTSQKRAPPFRR